jgi:[ribosomal protein S18]-alanine N-acetyltransferase
MMQPAELALVHAATFTYPPPWSEAAFASALADPAVILLTAPDARAFLLGRQVADEAEILTLATHPDVRRRGHARALVLRFLDAARDRGVTAVHLEVAEDNAAARALYAACGFFEAGRRPGYYRDASGRPVAALLLSRPLAGA